MRDQAAGDEASTIKDFITEIEGVRSAVLQREAALDVGQFGDHLQSARNLVHYLALRRFDLRNTQERLALLGISSLGRSEGHVLSNLDLVLAILYRLTGFPPPRRAVGGVAPPREPELTSHRKAAQGKIGRGLLRARTGGDVADRIAHRNSVCGYPLEVSKEQCRGGSAGAVDVPVEPID